MEKDKTKLRSLDLFPSMAGGSKLLIIDYDVTRYHSFDLFRYLLKDQSFFMKCDILYEDFVRETDPTKQLLWYYRNCPNMFAYDNFVNLYQNLTIESAENHMANEMLQEGIRFTPTVVDLRLGIIFNKPSITGYMLKYTWDTHESSFEHMMTKVYRSDHVFNLNMAQRIIEHHNINAVMVSSVDAAIILAERLAKDGYTSQISFIIGNYNYNRTDGYMRHLRLMNILEYRYKHEFGIFDAYNTSKQQEEET